MFDFNWYRLSNSIEDWRVLAERLRTEIRVNKYWYEVITLSIPRYSSSEDAARVSMLLNRRMQQTREMEREVEWLDAALSGSADSSTATRFAAIKDTDEPNPFLKYILLADAAALLAIWPLRTTLEVSGVGEIILILSAMMLGVSASGLLAGSVRVIREMFEARTLMRVAKRLPESELVPFVRAVRLREYQRTGGYTGVDAS